MNLDNMMATVTAVAMAFTALMTYRTNHVAKDTNRKATETANNMELVEKATNSMKDALVASTERSAMAEGQAIGLAEGRHEAEDRRLREDLDRQQLATQPTVVTPAVVVVTPPVTPT